MTEQMTAAYLDGRAGATTPGAALPYPLATEPVNQGAAAIQALATTLDPMVLVTLAAPPASAGFAGAYPMGQSIAATAAADTGWPTAVAGVVVTYRHSTGAVQYWYRLNTATPEVWARTLLSASASAWIPLSGGSYCIRTSNTAPSLPASTWSVVPIASATEAQMGADVVASGNGFQINRAGAYSVDFSCTMGANAGGNVLPTYGIGSLSAAPPADRRVANIAVASSQVANGAFTIVCAAADSVALWVTHNHTANITLGNRRMTVRRVGN